MKPANYTTGLVFWNEEEIEFRQYAKRFFSDGLKAALRETNPAWKFTQIEGPTIVPVSMIDSAYTNEDVWMLQAKDKALRPETTATSYLYAYDQLKHGIKPPFCVWQMGKSYRQEQDQSLKHMRLKEFYQQEFQCVYTEDTKNDYQTAVVSKIAQLIEFLVKRPVRVVDSDRLPSYSERTIDVEVDLGYKWMEMCSCSVRTDFKEKVSFTTSSGKVVEKGLKVLEVAFGIDRCVYATFLTRENQTLADE